MATIRIGYDPAPDVDIIAYRIYAGRASGVYDDVNSPKNIGLANPGLYDITPDGGDWFFAMTALDSETPQLESPPSAEIQGKFIEPRTP